MTGDNKQNTDGIRVDMLRRSEMGNMGNVEKIRYIIDKVREGRIVILEDGLKPNEHALLIERTMSEIDHDDFTGIEVESYPEEESNNKGILSRLLKNDTSDNDLTVVGPASRMETLHKDNNKISTLLTKG